MNYLQPDDIWNTFGVKSEEDFTTKYVLKGKFHSLVPKKIVDDYKIVERLIFYSYFNYPLIDEAFSKSTRIFEASVTLKLENAGLKKNGYESLHSKLKRLEKYCSKDLFEQWKHAKELRNQFAHKEAGVIMGIFLMNGFKHNLNMINTLFLESEKIKEKESLTSDLIKKSEHLRYGLFILQQQDKRILICSSKPYTIGTMNNFGQSLWVFIPVTGEKTITQLSDLPNSLILKLENIEITDNGLSAIESISKKAVTLISTEKFENVEKLIKHNNRIKILETSSPEISREYMVKLRHSIVKEISNFLYEEW